MTSALPAVTVVVVNFNSGRHLADVLAALAAQTFADFEALVYDCKSSDESFAAARDKTADERFKFVDLGLNLGFAAANNLGFAIARGGLVATLNPDAYPEPAWLAHLVAAAAEFPAAAAFGSTQRRFDAPGTLDGCGDVYGIGGFPWRGGYGWPVSSLPPDGETFSVCAAAAVYRTGAVREMGGFDERYFCYVEDVDLGFRLRLAGYGCRQVSRAVVRHVGGASTVDGGQAAFARYHGIRNAIWTFFKNMPDALLFLLAPVHLSLLAAACVSAARRGYFPPVARGIRDGLASLPRFWHSRRQIQKNRRINSLTVVQILEWSLSAMLRHRPRVW